VGGLGRDRLITAASLAGVVALAWLYLWRAGAPMHAGEGASMAMPLGLNFAMWAVMMAAMMLPSAAPTVLLYGAMVRKNAERGTALASVWTFVSGYLLAWAAFGLVATLLQAALEHAGLLTTMMDSASPWLTAGLLVAAGLYQLTPLKDLCLTSCRNPVRFLMTRWRPGAARALRMGLAHGAYCVGCCWLLMLLLFALGVMNLAWVALIAAFVAIEKLLPAGRLTARFAGVALIAVGLGVAVLGA
jgi:predicted metal-binding membrane protein